MHFDYRVLVMTSDNYLPAIRVFSYLFNQYWDNRVNVVVSGFSPPQFSLPENFSFISAGKQSDFPFHNWSDALYKTLEQFQDDVFVLMLEDYWITRPVNKDAVSLCVDFMRGHENVLKMDLAEDRLYAGGADKDSGTYSYLDLVKSKVGSPYHMSLWPGVWNSSRLLEVLIPNESPHDLEIAGTTRLSEKFPNLEVYGTKQNPLKITLGLRARDHTSVNVGDINHGDMSAMKSMGYFLPWGIR